MKTEIGKTAEEREETPFFNFSSQKLLHTAFSGLFTISVLIKDVNTRRTVPIHLAGHRNSLFTTPLEITLLHSPLLTTKAGQGEDTQQMYLSCGTLPKPCHVPAATRSPCRHMPESKTWVLPPQAQILLCSWIFLVALSALQTGNWGRQQTQAQIYKGFLASNLSLKTIPGLDLTSHFQEKRQGSGREKPLPQDIPSSALLCPFWETQEYRLSLIKGPFS